MATPNRRTKASPSTLVLLVRHGTTPSTGQVLPGRAPGLHLADAGRRAGGPAGRAPGGLGPGQSGPDPASRPVYASPLERTRETAAPVAAALGLAGPGGPRADRVRLRRVDREGAQEAHEAARVGHRAALPERLPLSRRRVLCRHAGRHGRDDGRPADPPPRRERRGGLPRRPDQGGRRRRPRHPPRPVPADRHLALLGDRHQLRAARPEWSWPSTRPGSLSELAPS